jgi:small subunit ribosomal protein S15
MATMHGHGKGKAGSHSPKPEKPYWLKTSEKEVEELILKLAKDGFSSEKIGLILRDTYSIPNVKIITKKKISQILRENKIKTETEDLKNLEKKFENLKKHLNKNKVDKVAKKGLQLTQSKIHRLRKYYNLE